MRLIRGLLFIFILISGLHGFAATGNYLKGKVSGLDRQKIFLSSLYGERVTRVDSTLTDESGSFTFTVSDNMPVGMYRISSGKDIFIDLILNKEDVEFTTSVFAVSDSLRFIKSAENQAYYFYMQLDRISQEKLSLITPVLDFYPEKDSFYKNAADEFVKIQKEVSQALDSMKTKQPDLFAVRIAKLQQTPFLSPSLTKDDRLNYLKMHYLDNADFNDTLLLHSNAWSNKAISYLSLYGNNRYSQEKLEAEFIKGLTVIMSAATVNPYIFKFLLDYYLGGFDKYHFDEVISYMAENFQDPFSCEDQERKTALQKKLENFKKIAPGKIAPAINLPDRNGKLISLASVQSEFTLVIFWSSECSHCVEMMPKVKELYDNQKAKRVEIYAVSLDNNKKSWTDFMDENKFRWIDVSDLKGFSSQAADDYNIYASPTMFLLDRDKKILARPVSYRELLTNLNEFGLQVSNN